MSEQQETATTGPADGQLTENIEVRPGRTRDTRLLERAIRQRWPISDEVRSKVISKLGTVVETGSAREATSAAKAIISAEAQNLQDEHAELNIANPAPAPVAAAAANVTVTVAPQASPAEMIQSALHEDNYLDYLRERKLTSNS